MRDESPWPSSAEYKHAELRAELGTLPRFPGPRRECLHCGLISQTSSRECPVCATPFPRSGRFARVLGALRRRA